MVRFSKTGADVTSAAVRLARAFTGRSKVLCCGYHGWHDWYIATTDRARGRARRGGRSDPHRRLQRHRLGRAGAGRRHRLRDPRAHRVRGAQARVPASSCCACATARGALLIFDEMWTGFRCALGGAQERFGVTADLACFSKAIANGMPLSVLTGRADVMRLLDKDVFFFTTFGGEALSLAAAKATIEVMQRDERARLPRVAGSRRSSRRYNDLARELGLRTSPAASGMGCRSLVVFEAKGLAAGADPLVHEVAGAAGAVPARRALVGLSQPLLLPTTTPTSATLLGGLPRGAAACSARRWRRTRWRRRCWASRSSRCSARSPASTPSRGRPRAAPAEDAACRPLTRRAPAAGAVLAGWAGLRGDRRARPHRPRDLRGAARGGRPGGDGRPRRRCLPPAGRGAGLARPRRRPAASRVDVTDARVAGRPARRRARAQAGRLDVLVNSAAVNDVFDEGRAAEQSRFETYPLELWQRALDGEPHRHLPALPDPGRRDGPAGRAARSSTSPRPTAWWRPTSASTAAPTAAQALLEVAPPTRRPRAAVLAFTRFLATYWADAGRAGQRALPGRGRGRAGGALRAQLQRPHAARPHGPAHEYRAPVVFLASDASSYMTGASLVVDGGWTAW